MTPTIAAFHGAGIPVGNVSSFMSGRTGTCGGSIPPAALTKSVASKRSPLAVFRTRTHHLVEGVSTVESAADFDFAYDGSIPSPLATIFLTSLKWFTISLGARLNDTHQGPAGLYTE